MNGKVILIDEEKCDGCMLCSIACSIAHTGDTSLERAHIKVWRTENEVFVPLTCHHCETPSCAQACPTKACHQDAESLRVLIDETKCIGCRSCVNACPFGHAHYDTVARVSAKCDYCDGEPACVGVCEPGAISYVFSDESSERKKRDAGMVLATVRRVLGPQATRSTGAEVEVAGPDAGADVGAASCTSGPMVG
jgi:anaerobic carbon-monoxide dehydrogenase iron sulfur subunit